MNDEHVGLGIIIITLSFIVGMAVGGTISENNSNDKVHKLCVMTVKAGTAEQVDKDIKECEK